ncbi:TIR domain-containing protein [Thioalkalivibrio sp. XN279]|uniref:TPR end-of-group domain-containing protein n=1 Tax=Thioalkalivibrio sp. XN279 TaxID=2714953 RepID=UPI00140E6400|nr:TIR domain-containing protein [Thioalkalivibrio sp. XN279]
MRESADVFISYSREDKDKVIALAEKLRASGVAVWMDVGGIDAATMWSEEIVNALDGAKVLLLMVTPSAVNSHNVAKEVILTSERKGHILPVHLEPTQIPAGLKYQLAGIQHIEYFQGDPDENLRVIVRSLERIGVPVKKAAPAARPEPQPVQAVAPAAPDADHPIEPGALAVLPFHNISPDEETDYFSDGLTEELIARLSLVSEIDLISRWASMQFKDTKQDIRLIGKELGARYVVGGSVRRFRDSVRITVQLVDAATNRQLWGNTYKGMLDDIFDIQEQVAKQIVEALKLRLSFAEEVSLTKRQTVNANAYDLYLRGQDYLYRLTKRSVEYAIQLFEKAIELDPRYAAAYAACSSAYGQMYQYFSREEAYRTKAQELSFKALMYDNNLPEAYTAMGLSYFSWGKFDEAAESGRKAIELNPDDFIAYWILSRIHLTLGNAKEAAELCRRVIELKPRFYVAYADLRMALQVMGETEEADALAIKLADEVLPTYLLQNPDDSRARMFYAIALAELGRRDEAIEEGSTALEMSPGDSVMLYNGACLYAQLGEIRKAVDALRQAIAGGTDIPGWTKNDPDLDPLRDDPEFIALTSGH